MTFDLEKARADLESTSSGPIENRQLRRGKWTQNHADSALAEIERLRREVLGTERDCLEVAGRIAAAVEFYEGDDLLGQISPHIRQLIGELEAVEASHEDEEVAHAETLQMLEVAKARVARLAEALKALANDPTDAWAQQRAAAVLAEVEGK